MESLLLSRLLGRLRRRALDELEDRPLTVVAQARLRLAQEEAEARVAQKEWEELGGGDASPLTLREPQLEEARAAVAAAEANLETAERNLERTEIRAPYAGRIRNESVDLGQFVTRGGPVGSIGTMRSGEMRCTTQPTGIPARPSIQVS